MKKVSVIVVNWNGAKYLRRCIDHVIMQRYKDIEIIVVDNGSTDNSLEEIKKYRQIKLIKNKKNEGFSRSQNLGISESKGEYILPLNFDVFITADFISQMVSAIESKKDVGSVSGRLIKSFDNTLIDSTGIIMKNLFPADRGENEKESRKYIRKELIFGASGAAPLYKKQMLEDIKTNGEYFDEDFGSYVEDVDLAWRAQLKGWKCLYNPKAVAFHERGVTRKGDDEMLKKYEIIGHRNRYLMIFKNLSLKSFLSNFVNIFKAESRFFAGMICKKRFYVLKSYAGFLSLLPRMCAKRAVIQKNKKIENKQIEHLLFSE